MSPSSIGAVTDADARRAQLRAWYSDPARNLPRKVVADVLWLLDEMKATYARNALLEAVLREVDRVMSLDLADVLDDPDYEDGDQPATMMRAVREVLAGATGGGT